MKNFTVRKYQQKQVHLFTECSFGCIFLLSFWSPSRFTLCSLSKWSSSCRITLMNSHPGPGSLASGNGLAREKSCEDGLKTFLENFKIESGHVQTQKGKQPFQTQMVILEDQSLVGSPCGQAHSRVPLEMCCPASPVVPH